MRKNNSITVENTVTFDDKERMNHALFDDKSNVIRQTNSIIANETLLSRQEAVLLILQEFSACLLPKLSQYEMKIPYGEGDEEISAIYLYWSGNGLSLALYVTDFDTQIVCDGVPPSTFVSHNEDGYATKVKNFLLEPKLSGYFPELP